MKYLTFLLILTTATSSADVVLDGSLGQQATLSGAQLAIKAEYGQQDGGNLFHSFHEFNINVNQTAQFLAPANVNNIIARVTGGQVSFIDGKLIAPSALYFFNPNGIVLGQNSQLDINGSLHLATAQQLNFSDGQSFSATKPASRFSSAEPIAFGFLSDAPLQFDHAKINHANDLSLTSHHLQWDNSQVHCEGALLVQSDQGRVQLNDSQIQARGVFIQNGQFVNLNHSQISSQHAPISVQSKNVSLSQRSLLDSTVSQTDSQGGPIVVAADNIHLDGHSSIQTGVLPGQTADAGNIWIKAKTLSLTDYASIISSHLGAGDGGLIQLDCQQLRLENALISSAALGGGRAGNIEITAQQHSLVNSLISSLGLKGQGGDIMLRQHQNLTLLNSGIAAQLGLRAPISVTGGNITIDSQHVQLKNSAISTESLGLGNAGNISVISQKIQLQHDSAITSQAQQAGGGELYLGVRDLLQLNHSHLISRALGAQTQHQGANITVNKPTFMVLETANIFAGAKAGQGGNIDLQASYLFQSASSRIDASSLLGIAGQINIHAVYTDINAHLGNQPLSYLSIRPFSAQYCANPQLGNRLVFRRYYHLPVY
jgi:filamentous hemagglutinin family protein